MRYCRHAHIINVSSDANFVRELQTVTEILKVKFTNVLILENKDFYERKHHLFHSNLCDCTHKHLRKDILPKQMLNELNAHVNYKWR